jgi:hypothetical protein
VVLGLEDGKRTRKLIIEDPELHLMSYRMFFDLREELDDQHPEGTGGTEAT